MNDKFPKSIASTPEQIKGRVAGMVLFVPEYVDKLTDGGVDGVYAELEHSLGLARTKLGDEKYHKLIEMARESKQYFAEGKSKDGRFLLQDMHEMLGREKKAN